MHMPCSCCVELYWITLKIPECPYYHSRKGSRQLNSVGFHHHFTHSPAVLSTGLHGLALGIVHWAWVGFSSLASGKQIESKPKYVRDEDYHFPVFTCSRPLSSITIALPSLWRHISVQLILCKNRPLENGNQLKTTNDNLWPWHLRHYSICMLKDFIVIICPLAGNTFLEHLQYAVRMRDRIHRPCSVLKCNKM